MRVSYEIGQRFYAILVAKRDNTKGSLSEVEFYSWLYTIGRLQAALLTQQGVIEGMLVQDYEIASKLKNIFVPREVRYKNNTYYRNLICHEMAEGHTPIHYDGELQPGQVQPMFSVTATPLTELQTLAQERIDAGHQNVQQPVGRQARLMTPAEFKLVQEVIFKQATGKAGEFTGMSDIRKDSNMIKELSDVIDAANFNGNMFTEDRTNGIRPITLDANLLPFIDLDYAAFDAVENFVTWFNKQLFSSNN